MAAGGPICVLFDDTLARNHREVEAAREAAAATVNVDKDQLAKLALDKPHPDRRFDPYRPYQHDEVAAGRVQVGQGRAGDDDLLDGDDPDENMDDLEGLHVAIWREDARAREVREAREAMRVERDAREVERAAWEAGGVRRVAEGPAERVAAHAAETEREAERRVAQALVEQEQEQEAVRRAVREWEARLGQAAPIRQGWRGWEGLLWQERR